MGHTSKSTEDSSTESDGDYDDPLKRFQRRKISVYGLET